MMEWIDLLTPDHDKLGTTIGGTSGKKGMSWRDDLMKKGLRLSSHREGKAILVYRLEGLTG